MLVRAAEHLISAVLALRAAPRYPVMLKASWGGGGKGIRKVQSDEDVRAVFKQIQGEVSRGG
jgi:acetyl-CoA carboxylase/biotin carboxylase 1